MKRSQTSRRSATRSSLSSPFSMTKNTSTSFSARIACCVTYCRIAGADPDQQHPPHGEHLSRCATVLVLGGTGEARALAAALARRRGRRRRAGDLDARRPRRRPAAARGRGARRRLRRAGRAGGLHPRAAGRRRRRRDAPVRRADVVVGVRGLRADRDAAAAARPPAVRARSGDRLARGRDARRRRRAAARRRAARLPDDRPPGAAPRSPVSATRSSWSAASTRPIPQALPPAHELLLDRGPFTLAGELELIDRHALDVLITKDSGGAMTQAKLDAARERGLPVIVVARPPRPPTRETVPDRRAGARLARRGQAHG